MTTTIEAPAFGVARQQMEVSIAAAPGKVWKALTSRIGEWWPSSFVYGGENARFVLEEKPGGRLYEDWGNDEGFLWGHVVYLKRDAELRIICPLMSDTEGPGTVQTIFKLESVGAETLLKMDEVAFGCVTEKTGKSLEGGWKELLGTHLKGYVEKG